MSTNHEALEVQPTPESGGRRKKSSALRTGAEYLLTFLIALVVAILVKTFLIQPFYIPSPSMNPTLLTNDKILVSKLHPGVMELNRGDVIVFEDPGNWVGMAATQIEQNPVQQALSFIGLVPDPNQQHLVKRLIAVGGDRISCQQVGGNVRINDIELHETYINPGMGACQNVFNTVVPNGKVFVMGDNRFNSADSAYHLVRGDEAFIDESLITGKAIAVFWPMNRIGGITDGADVFTEVNNPQ